MKNTIKTALALLLVVAAVSCKDDKTNEPPTSTLMLVQFDQPQISLAKSESKLVKLNFHKASTSSGVIAVEPLSLVSENLSTQPPLTNGVIKLPFTKGASSVELRLSNNYAGSEILQEVVDLVISDMPGDFTTGKNKQLKVQLSSEQSTLQARFLMDSAAYPEGSLTELPVELILKEPAAVTGDLWVLLEGHNSFPYISTVPACDPQGLIHLKVAKGDRKLQFKLRVEDDQLLRGHQKLSFRLATSDGSWLGGGGQQLVVKVIDDELRNKPRSWESLGGGWSSKNTYEYDEQGRISKVHWENRSPGLRQGTYTYYYAANGLVERINRYPNVDDYFTHENGRILRSKTIRDGVMKSYTNYEYDLAGKVIGAVQYYLQPSGEYKMSMRYHYTYHPSGNLHQRLHYTPDAGGGFSLVEKHSYEDYTRTANPFLLMELVPNLQSQAQMPASYSLDAHGMSLSYNFRYDTNREGLPVTRYTSGSANEVARYTYY